jgi:hypothetical protein
VRPCLCACAICQCQGGVWPRSTAAVTLAFAVCPSPLHGLPSQKCSACSLTLRPWRRCLRSKLSFCFLIPNFLAVQITSNVDVTAKSQSCDQRKMTSYKVHYWGLLVRWMLEQANKPGNESKQLKGLAPTFYQTILWPLLAWKEEVTANTVKNCWCLACCHIQCWT